MGPVEVRGQLVGGRSPQLSPAVTEVPRVKLRSSGLPANTFLPAEPSCQPGYSIFNEAKVDKWDQS